MRLGREAFEMATGQRYDSTLTDAHGFLRQDIEAVRLELQEHGALPEGAESFPMAVYLHQKNRLRDTYSPAVAWLNAKIMELQPENPFEIKKPPSLQAARELLEKHKDRVPEELWKFPGSKYYIPHRALKPYGIGMISRLLASQGVGVPPPQPARQQPAPVSSQAPQADEALRWLSGGHASQAYQFLVQKLFPDGSAESEIGNFLARVPSPSRPQVADLIQTLPEQIEEEIEFAGGFDRLVHEIDTKILAAVKSPETQAELERVLGSPQAVTAALKALRRTVFSRMFKAA